MTDPISANLLDGSVSLRTLVLLHCVHNGYTSAPELTERSGLSRRTVNRQLSQMEGRGRYVSGKAVTREGEPLLISRKHPHQQGRLYQLTPAGKNLLIAVKELCSSAPQKHTD